MYTQNDIIIKLCQIAEELDQIDPTSAAQIDQVAEEISQNDMPENAVSTSTAAALLMGNAFDSLLSSGLDIKNLSPTEAVMLLKSYLD